MIPALSLLPLAAALLSGVLALLALTTSPVRSRTMWFFVLLNMANGIWSFSYFLQFILPGKVELVLVQPGEPLHWALVLQALGIAASPTYGFLFGAAYAGKRDLTRGWPLALVHIPLLYTLLVASTNPLHHLFIRAAHGGSYIYGPLAWPHQLSGTALGAFGMGMIVWSSWRRGTRASRRQAIVIGSAALVPMIGSIVWMHRFRLGLTLTINPGPMLVIVPSIALAYELVRSGLADIVPRATQTAFDAIGDAAIALDCEGAIAAMNAAARALFEGWPLGTPLSAASPELAEAAQPCLSSAAGYTGFDFEKSGRIFWGRARPMRDRRGILMGFILLLTDVTEVRLTQARLAELDASAEMA